MFDVATLAQRFAALGHEARLGIVRRLLAAHPDGHVVGELQEALGIPGSTLTHHLDALHHEGLISKRREGRFLRYRAEGEALRGLLDFLYAECCQGSAAVAPPDGLVTLRLPGGEDTEPGRRAGGESAATPEPADDETPAATSWRAW